MAPTASKKVLSLLEKHGISECLSDLMHHRRRRMQQERFLGLDISTRSTGYAIVDGSGRLHGHGLMTPNQATGRCIFEIGRKLESDLQRLKDPEMIYHVGIEDFMKTYFAGRFHTQGLFKLAQLNGIVSYTCYDLFQTKPIHVHPSTARSLFGLNHRSDSKSAPGDVKQVVLDHVQSLYPSIESHDEADALIIANFIRIQTWIDVLLQQSHLSQRFQQAYQSLNATRLDNKFPQQETKKQAYVQHMFERGIHTWVQTQSLNGKIFPSQRLDRDS